MEETNQFPPIIELNVGGQLFTTTLQTLTKCQDKNNMLAAMFSGNFSVVKDKDGRFFIDADGSNFIHILNFLRYGDVPPPHLAETVYREAAYFGINELVRELEKYPTILAKIQRNNFRNSFPGYAECMETVLKSACVETTEATSDIKLLLYSRNVAAHNQEFNNLHICVCQSTDGNKFYSADAKLGPWAKDNCTEKDVLNCIIFDLESQGFTVTGRHYAQCSYEVEPTRCHKTFYNISFHWWKS